MPQIKIFGAVYDRFMNSIGNVHLNSRRARLPSGMVLEIGMGTGTNFEYYNEGIELIGIEPSP